MNSEELFQEGTLPSFEIPGTEDRLAPKLGFLNPRPFAEELREASLTERACQVMSHVIAERREGVLRVRDLASGMYFQK